MMGYWSISSIVLSEEAVNLGLEVEIIAPEKNFFRISGNGRTHFFKSTDFGGNSSLGAKIANDKELTHKVLERAGLPIAHSAYVDIGDFAKFDSASVEHLRYPLVLKPHDQAHGNGVLMNIRDYSDLHAKLAASFETYTGMIIQEQIEGREYRVLVMHDEVILAYNRIPPVVVGDGTHTIIELVESENRDNVLRGNDYEQPLSHIRTDGEFDHCIAQQGLDRNSIPEAWQAVVLRSNSNMWTGATAANATHLVHPETREICVKACRETWLALAGVDIITTDISRPLSETGGIILELNSTPGIWGDRELTGINSGKRILEKLFFE